jgi:hypothetical protein
MGQGVHQEALIGEAVADPLLENPEGGLGMMRAPRAAGGTRGVVQGIVLSEWC